MERLANVHGFRVLGFRVLGFRVLGFRVKNLITLKILNPKLNPEQIGINAEVSE